MNQTMNKLRKRTDVIYINISHDSQDESEYIHEYLFYSQL